jgi:hypothetical protein
MCDLRHGLRDVALLLNTRTKMRIYAARGAHTSAVAAQLLWLLLGAGACISCQADDHIDTDGPDFVDSSEVVGRGRFQFEANLQYQQQNVGATHQQLIGTPTLLRFGLTDSVEARVEIGGWQWLQIRDPLMPTEVQSGWADTAIGAKWHFQSPDSEGRPSACLIFQVETPSGSEPFRGHGYRPSLRSVITWDLSETVSASIMPGAAYEATSDGHRYTAGSFGATIGRWWTERFRAFVEFSGEQFAQAKDGGNIVLWDAGASYLLGTNWQLGTRLGVGANANSPSFFGLVMLAGRF